MLSSLLPTGLLLPFQPYQELAHALLPLTLDSDEGGDLRILCAAVLLHDCVAVEKNSPQRPLASRLAAEKAATMLAALGWAATDIEKTAHAIEAHSFSAAILPLTLEAKILQDADRLDALGMIGVARCFYIGGRLHRALYDAADPLAQRREYDDRRFTLDHFETKLFKLQDGFQTSTGRRMAAQRTARMRRFLSELQEEV